jgi:hypothetical protein
MTNFRILVLALLSLALVGCATTGSNSDKAIDDRQCPNFNDLPLVNAKLLNDEINSHWDTVKKITNEKSYLYEGYPAKTFTGIASVKLNGHKLEINLVEKALFEEYSVPLTEVVKEHHYHKWTSKAVLGSIFTAGLAWVFPSTKEELLFYKYGCTEKTLPVKEPDYIEKIKTGKSTWRDAESRHKFLISGFDKDYERDDYWHTSQTQLEIDMSTVILNTDFTKKTTLKVTCLDCDLLGPEEQSLYKDVKKTVEITADFREIKAALVAEEKKREFEQAKRNKETAMEQDIESNEELGNSKEAQKVPLDKFKAQCKELGFKTGTPDFGNCVLELNDAK